MRARHIHRALHGAALAACSFAAACATGSGGASPLAYRLPDPTDVTYAAGDTLVIEINALGQSLSLRVNSTAQYAVAFARAGDGLRVRLSVRDLAADVTLPMAAPLSVDESVVQGDLVLGLDRTGRVTILEAPDVAEIASPFFAGPTIAHSFFPGLPGRAVSPGDTWVDSVSYAEQGDTGDSSQSTVTTYTAVGDTLVAGRALLRISFEGRQEMRQAMTLQGLEVTQATTLTVQGRALWDLQSGLMVERESHSMGTGTVRLAVMPNPLPTSVQIHSHVRLEPR